MSGATTYDTPPGLAITCNHCGKGYIYGDDQRMLAECLSPRPTCQSCQKQYDPLVSHVQSLRDGKKPFFGFLVYRTIGAKTTTFDYELCPNETITLDLANFGVPNDGRVIRVDHTANRESQPALASPVVLDESYLNPALPTNQVVVYGREVKICSEDESVVEAPTKISAMVSWLSNADVAAFYPLFSAIQSFHRNNHAEAILAANSSVEFSLYQASDRALKDFVGKDKREQFLTNQCTYSGQLGILSKLICALYRLGTIPSEMLASLTRLRKLRNDAAHTGRLPDGVVQDEIYLLISTAIYATHIFSAIAREIERKAVDAG